METLDVNCPCGSGKRFAECHGVTPGAQPVGSHSVQYYTGAITTMPKMPERAPLIVQPALPIKLDLAAGQNVREGFEGVDVWPSSKHVLDLMRYPWPWADNSVDELHCSHFIEHIPMIFVDPIGNEVPMGTPGSKDALIKFFDECHRILKPEAWMTVICPCARNDRAFWDPTHRRFIVAQTFLYFSAEWRALNKLDHYNATSDFGVACNPLSVRADLQHKAQEVAAYKFQHEWNTIEDWIAKLQKKLPAKPTQG